MLMEIGPLPMRGALVMTMVMISPSGREVSPAEQLRQSPRLVPPHGGGVSSEKMAYDFSPIKRLHIAEYGHRRATRGPTRQGGAPWGVGRAPTLVARVWASSGGFFRQYFLLIPKTASVKFQDFWSCAEQVSNNCSFSSQNPSCRHSPSSCKPCKIRENSHKYCDIMCINNP